MITLLAGSLVWDGGFNVRQAGTSKVDPVHVKKIPTLREIFFDRPWARMNIENSNRIAAERAEFIRKFEEVVNAELKPGERCADLEARVKALRLMIKKATEEEEAKSKEDKIKLEKLQIRLKAKQAYLEWLRRHYEALKAKAASENEARSTEGDNVQPTDGGITEVSVEGTTDGNTESLDDSEENGEVVQKQPVYRY
jgi:hypothetical protein